MKYFVLSLLFLLVGCKTAPTVETVDLPQTLNSPQVSYIKEAAGTKVRIGEAGSSYVFDFYYGPKGSYYIVVTSSKKPFAFEMNDYDTTLSINSADGTSPEVISLASEDPQVLSGFGQVREGNTSFELSLTPVDASLALPIKFKFKVDMKSFL